MSIQQNFPAISPSLSLNFARSKTLDPRITFTRTSSGTRTNETGLVEVVPANSPRFDHSYDPVSGTVRSLGLLVEESRSNLISYSEDFTNSIWDAPFTGRSRATIVTRTGVDDPSGGTTAATFKNGGSLSDELIWRIATGTANVPYTMSVWIRRRSGTGQIDLVVGDNIEVEITNQVTNQWKRISLTATPTTTTVRAYILIKGLNDEIDIWGAQLEQGSFPTSYIPTTNSTVTRTPDNVSMVGENFSSWYNQDEGTIYVSQKLKSIDTVDRNSLVYLINGGSGSDIFYNVKTGNTNIFVFADDGTNYSRWQENGDSTDTKAIWAYDVSGDDFKPYWNGIEGINESTPNTPSATSHTQLEIGPTVGAKYNGHISKLTYYPRRLTNAQLQALTK